MIPSLLKTLAAWIQRSVSDYSAWHVLLSLARRQLLCFRDARGWLFCLGGVAGSINDCPGFVATWSSLKVLMFALQEAQRGLGTAVESTDTGCPPLPCHDWPGWRDSVLGLPLPVTTDLISQLAALGISTMNSCASLDGVEREEQNRELGGKARDWVAQYGVAPERPA